MNSLEELCYGQGRPWARHIAYGGRGLKSRITNLISGCRFVSSGQIILENKRFPCPYEEAKFDSWSAQPLV
jgi:hypothetical protein